MAQIAFKKKYIEPIQQGRKTSTLRLNVPRGVKEGDFVEAWCGWGDGPFAILHIGKIERGIRLSDLTDCDAQDDGYETVQELRKSIEKLYGDGDEEFVRISFACEEADDGT